MIDKITCLEDIQELVRSGVRNFKPYGYVYTRETEDLILFKYLETATFENKWDFLELVSRGLVLEKETGNVIANPYPKFFNYGENNRFPTKEKILYASEKADGCFLHNTMLNLWGGGKIKIGTVVNKKLTPILIGIDINGNIVPTKVIDWHNNGPKYNWIDIKYDQNTVGTSKKLSNLRVTKNHHILINGKYTPAENIKKDDELCINDIICDDKIYHLIQSSLLGDGYVTKPFYNGVCSYVEGHAKEQHEYVYYLRELLGSCVANVKDRISGYGSHIKKAASKNYANLKILRDSWYSENGKKLPDDLSWMDDFSVAKWYMDDGSLHHNNLQNDRATLSTHAFSESEVDRLINKLEDMYSVCCVKSYSKGWYIRINYANGSINNFWSAISKHIHPCCRYKLPKEFKNVDFTPYNIGGEKYTYNNVKVVSVNDVEFNKRNFCSGSLGFDITTETSNYFCKNVLVHNSLGIAFNYKNKWNIITNGSFESEQGKEGEKILYEKYPKFIANANPDYTYLSEIISPVTSVVVRYGDVRELKLHGIRKKNSTGINDGLLDKYEIQKAACNFDMPCVKFFDCLSIQDVKNLLVKSGLEEEGFIIHFKSGEMYKLKSDDYIRLHRLVSDISERRIWEHMCAGTFDECIQIIPNEFHDEIKTYRKKIEDRIDEVMLYCLSVYSDTPQFDNRKSLALHIQNNNDPWLWSYLFVLFDKGPEILRKTILKDYKKLYNFTDS